MDIVAIILQHGGPTALVVAVMAWVIKGQREDMRDLRDARDALVARLEILHDKRVEAVAKAAEAFPVTRDMVEAVREATEQLGRLEELERGGRSRR